MSAATGTPTGATMSTSVVGRTEMITGEELMVFAASRGVTLPPGTPGIAERLGESGEAQAVTSLAARVLLCRGVNMNGGLPEKDHLLQARDHDLEALLMTACEPVARVVVTAGKQQQQTHVVAFSIGESFTVAQVIFPLDVHVLRACATGEVRSSLVEATRVATLSDGEVPPTRLELGWPQLERIGSGDLGRANLVKMLASTTGWETLGEQDQSSLLAVLAGEAFTVSVLFHQVARGSDGTGIIANVGWAVTTDGEVWRLDRELRVPRSEAGEQSGLVAVRSGRRDIQERLDQASDAVGVPEPG